jgi:hypothetical protein
LLLIFIFIIYINFSFLNFCRWYEEYKRKLALDASFHIATEHESGDFIALLSGLYKTKAKRQKLRGKKGRPKQTNKKQNKKKGKSKRKTKKKRARIATKNEAFSNFSFSRQSPQSKLLTDYFLELKKEPSRGKIGGDISLQGGSKPKLEYKMSRRTLGIAITFLFFCIKYLLYHSLLRQTVKNLKTNDFLLNFWFHTRIEFLQFSRVNNNKEYSTFSLLFLSNPPQIFLMHEDISVRRTKEEKAQAKMRWKKTIFDAKGECTVCAAEFSSTKRPV